MHKPHALVLENVTQELAYNCKKFRADIYGLMQMLENAEAIRRQLMGYLAEKSTKAALKHKQTEAFTSIESEKKRGA